MGLWCLAHLRARFFEGLDELDNAGMLQLAELRYIPATAGVRQHKYALLCVGYDVRRQGTLDISSFGLLPAKLEHALPGQLRVAHIRWMPLLQHPDTDQHGRDAFLLAAGVMDLPQTASAACGDLPSHGIVPKNFRPACHLASKQCQQLTSASW